MHVMNALNESALEADEWTRARWQLGRALVCRSVLSVSVADQSVCSDQLDLFCHTRLLPYNHALLLNSATPAGASDLCNCVAKSFLTQAFGILAWSCSGAGDTSTISVHHAPLLVLGFLKPYV